MPYAVVTQDEKNQIGIIKYRAIEPQNTIGRSGNFEAAKRQLIAFVQSDINRLREVKTKWMSAKASDVRVLEETFK